MTPGRRSVIVVALLGLVATPLVMVPESPARAVTYGSLKPIQRRLLSGTASVELGPDLAALRAKAPASSAFGPAAGGSPSECARRYGTNVTVNQNCLNLSDPDLAGRGQAQNETSIAADPTRSSRLVAAYNDYRRGDGTCGVSYSLDGGRTWADATTPNGFVRGDFLGKPRQYWQSSGDPSVAWDTRGNAYLSCQAFNRGSSASVNADQSSGLYVFRSTGTGGASWNFPGRPVAELNDTPGTGSALLDKQLLTVDASTTSRYRDRVYVTWTTFAADGTAYIYGSYSAGYGETFSKPVLVSRDSDLCPNALGQPTPNGRCNMNQFSQPFTAPDGTLYVTWANFNNVASHGLPGEERIAATDNRNQMLLARSTDGGATFSAPVKVGDYYDLPDCATYQNGLNEGRACIPEKAATTNSIFRATNYPVGSVNPRTGAVAVTYGSYLNKHSNEANGCVPTGFAESGNNTYEGVKTAGACNNDILVSVSTDRGATFAGGSQDPRVMATVTTAPGQATTDQFWQWASFTATGSLAVSYYDRQYGNDETTGSSDVSLSTGPSTGNDLTTSTVRRVSSAASPPPTQFSGTFWGDYTGMAIAGGLAYPLWSDTRAPAFFLCPGTGTAGTPPRVCTATGPGGSLWNDENVVTAPVPVG